MDDNDVGVVFIVKLPQTKSMHEAEGKTRSIYVVVDCLHSLFTVGSVQKKTGLLFTTASEVQCNAMQQTVRANYGSTTTVVVAEKWTD